MLNAKKTISNSEGCAKHPLAWQKTQLPSTKCYPDFVIKTDSLVRDLYSNLICAEISKYTEKYHLPTGWLLPNHFCFAQFVTQWQNCSLQIWASLSSSQLEVIYPSMFSSLWSEGSKTELFSSRNSYRRDKPGWGTITQI